MKISLATYGTIISDVTSGDQIYSEIKKKMEAGKKVDVDFAGVHSMATFCAKQIFGRLYIELGSTVFHQNIVIHNANPDVRLIIRDGIEKALEEKA